MGFNSLINISGTVEFYSVQIYYLCNYASQTAEHVRQVGFVFSLWSFMKQLRLVVNPIISLQIVQNANSSSAPSQT